MFTFTFHFLPPDWLPHALRGRERRALLFVFLSLQVVSGQTTPANMGFKVCADTTFMGEPGSLRT